MAMLNTKFNGWVVLKNDVIIPTKRPIGRIIEVYPGKDRFVRAATVKTVKGVHKRLPNKIALLLLDNYTFLVYSVIVTLTYLYHSFLRPCGLDRWDVGSYMHHYAFV